MDGVFFNSKNYNPHTYQNVCGSNTINADLHNLILRRKIFPVSLANPDKISEVINIYPKLNKGEIRLDAIADMRFFLPEHTELLKRIVDSGDTPVAYLVNFEPRINKYHFVFFGSLDNSLFIENDINKKFYGFSLSKKQLLTDEKNNTFYGCLVKTEHGHTGVVVTDKDIESKTQLELTIIGKIKLANNQHYMHLFDMRVMETREHLEILQSCYKDGSPILVNIVWPEKPEMPMGMHVSYKGLWIYLPNKEAFKISKSDQKTISEYGRICTGKDVFNHMGEQITVYLKEFPVNLNKIAISYFKPLIEQNNLKLTNFYNRPVIEKNDDIIKIMNNFEAFYNNPTLRCDYLLKLKDQM